MVHGVADNVHDGVTDAVYNGLIHFGVLALDDKSSFFAKLLGHITHNTLHLLEGAGDRNHANGHTDILKLIGQFAQLSRGLCKVVQLQASNIG